VAGWSAGSVTRALVSTGPEPAGFEDQPMRPTGHAGCGRSLGERFLRKEGGQVVETVRARESKAADQRAPPAASS
jgi:hypothetical protein